MKVQADIAKKLISIGDALEVIQRNMPRTKAVQCTIREAAGKFLYQDVHAPEPSPRYTNSAMDGYGVRWLDVAQATVETPVKLIVVGESQAGHHFDGVVRPGQAIRINTGAALAEGCDTVVRVEDTREVDGTVLIHSVKKMGQDVRMQGEEFQVGDLLLPRGTQLSAPQMGLLAAIGIETVQVHAPCRVSLVITGSELVAAGEEAGPYQIRDANKDMLICAIEESGGIIEECLHVVDDEEETSRIIGGAQGDVVVCTGGISMGRHDHVKGAAQANQFEPLFWRINQKPGKPLFFARRGEQLFFGLPGNPVSAFMCFTHYVRPLISALNGHPFGWPMISAYAESDISNRGSRVNMIRVSLTWHGNGGFSISSAKKQGSHMLTSIVEADGYIILEPGQAVKAGERINVYRYGFQREPVWF